MKILLGLVLLGFFLTGCDPVYPPVVMNGYSEPVEVSLSFAGNIPSQVGIRLPPKTKYVQRRQGLRVLEITIKRASGVLQSYRESDLEAARSTRKVQFEVWIISETGLKLGDKEDISRIMRGK